jgi:hypothetical protein
MKNVGGELLQLCSLGAKFGRRLREPFMSHTSANARDRPQAQCVNLRS